MPTQVLHRTVRLFGDDTDCHFASVDDGSTWIEIDRPPTQGDHDSIAKLIDGIFDPETGERSGHITVSNRYFGTMAPSTRVSDAQVAADKTE